jgi:hypothetical protein
LQTIDQRGFCNVLKEMVKIKVRSLKSTNSQKFCVKWNQCSQMLIDVNVGEPSHQQEDYYWHSRIESAIRNAIQLKRIGVLLLYFWKGALQYMTSDMPFIYA